MKSQEKIRLLAFFCAALSLLTVLFFYFRSYFHAHQHYFLLWGSAVFFALLILSMGYVFGRIVRKMDYAHDLGFFYHATTYLIFNGIWLFFIASGNSIAHDFYWTVINVMVFWGIGLGMHFYFFLKNRKRLIRGMEREELFE